MTFLYDAGYSVALLRQKKRLNPWPKVQQSGFVWGNDLYLPSGAIYFYQVVVVRDAIIGGLGARPLKAYHRWIKIRSTYWYVHMCVCGSHLIIANITHHRQFICWDTYLWYCIVRTYSYGICPPKTGGISAGQRPRKEHIPPPIMTSLVMVLFVPEFFPQRGQFRSSGEINSGNVHNGRGGGDKNKIKTRI